MGEAGMRVEMVNMGEMAIRVEMVGVAVVVMGQDGSSGGGFITMSVLFMPLNCTLKNS